MVVRAIYLEQAIETFLVTAHLTIQSFLLQHTHSQNDIIDQHISDEKSVGQLNRYVVYFEGFVLTRRIISKLPDSLDFCCLVLYLLWNLRYQLV